MARILKCVNHILGQEKGNEWSRNKIAEHNYRSTFKLKLSGVFGSHPNELNDYIYIYYICKDTGMLICDRSVGRGGLGPSRAKTLVAGHRSRGHESFYTIGTLCRHPALN